MIQMLLKVLGLSIVGASIVSGQMIGISVAQPAGDGAPRISSSKSDACSSGRIRVEGKCMTSSQAISFCGPGYRVVGSSCVHQNSVPTANKPAKPQCPKGQVWSKAELCHYDD